MQSQPFNGIRRRMEPKEVTRTDRVKFSNQVNYLTSEELGHIVKVIKTKCPAALQEVEKEVHFETESS